MRGSPAGVERGRAHLRHDAPRAEHHADGLRAVGHAPEEHPGEAHAEGDARVQHEALEVLEVEVEALQLGHALSQPRRARAREGGVVRGGEQLSVQE